MQFKLADGTGTVNLKFLMRDWDRHGNERLYVRKRGKKVRLQSIPGTQEFMEEYQAALAGITQQPTIQDKVSPQSLKWLVTTYCSSKDFARLGIKTQASRRGILDEVVQSHGDKRFKMLRRKHVKILRDEKGLLPHAANNRLKTLGYLFKWAIDAEHMFDNPARDVGKIDAPSEGHHTWTTGEILQFMEKHPADTKAGLALALLLYVGVRRSDVVKLGRQMETSDGGLRLIETKGSAKKIKVTEVSIHPQLRAVLDMHKNNHLTYLVTVYGKPFSSAGFGNWFRKQCDSAGLPHCSAHGVRKGGATLIADNGASTEQLMAMYGWTNAKQAHDYTKRANRKKLAREASKLLSFEDQKPNETAPLLEMVRK